MTIQQPVSVPTNRPTVSREVGTSILLSVPIVIVAELLAGVIPARLFDSLPIENMHGARRLILFFVIGYLFAVPYLVRRIDRAAVKAPHRTRDLKLAGILLLVLGPIVALPALLLWLGPTAAARYQSFYLLAVGHWFGLWLIGAILCFASALAVWLIAYALNLDNKNP